MAGEIDPLQLLREDCKDDDQETVMLALNRLPTVALALGPARSRTELMQFLAEFVETDNDEAMTVIAKQLGDFTDLVGGPAHAVVLLPLLERLSGEEESTVRDQAVESLNKLIVRLAKPDVQSKVVTLIKRLANGDWFTTRVSACGLVPTAYPAVPEASQLELRQVYLNLCNDDTPMVRRAAYTTLGRLAAQMQRQHVKQDLLPIIKALAQDDLDSMRVYTSECCAALGARMETADFLTYIMPIVEGLQDDTSWRVRQALAKDMTKLCEAATEPVASKRLLPIFIKLLKDREAEVRISCCRELAKIAPLTRSGLLELLPPCLDTLAVDPVVNVRVAVAQSLCTLCPYLGKETSAKILVPLIQQLCKDEHPEVRNFIINNIDSISDALGSAGVTNILLPALLDLSKDAKWRVRMAVIDKMTLLGKHVGVKTFEKKLQPVLIVALSDHVFAIRDKACEQVGGLVRLFGGKWAEEKFFPSAFTIYDKTTNYLHRMTCLQIVRQTASSAGADVVEKSLLPLVLNAATDDVPNVRIAGARAMADLIPHMDKTVAVAKLKPTLLKLAKDSDPDVCFFASQALKLFN